MWRVFLPHNFLYFLESFFYFLFSKKDNFKILFYTSSNFNRGEKNINYFIDPLYNLSLKNKINALVYEEPFLINNKNRSNNYIKADFLLFFILFFRKFLKGSFIERDRRIGALFFKYFLNNKIENIVVLSNSLTSFFRGAYPNANIYDYQHGVIYSNHNGYIIDKNVPEYILKNNIKILLFGKGFKQILSNVNTYYEKNSIVLGCCKPLNITHSNNENYKLVTLQFTDDHTSEENNILFNDLYKYLKNHSNYKFILKHHPRFKNNINDSKLISLPNVSFSKLPLIECFKLCDIHVTAYSTTVFEAACLSIPSVFYSKFKSNIYLDDFNYPVPDSINEVNKNIINFGKIAKQWSKKYYEDLNKDKWIKLMS